MSKAAEALSPCNKTQSTFGELHEKCAFVLSCTFEIGGKVENGVASFSYVPDQGITMCVWRSGKRSLRLVTRIGFSEHVAPIMAAAVAKISEVREKTDSD